MYWYEAGLWNVNTSFQVLKSRDKRSIMACLFQVTSVNRKCGLLLTHMYVNMGLFSVALCRFFDSDTSRILSLTSIKPQLCAADS